MYVRNQVANYDLPLSGRHIPALDGFRGVAVLLVLAHHFVLYSGFEPAAYLDHQVRRLAVSGWVGVDLFFVLSGFLITGILLDSKGVPRYFGNFYTRRVLRIFPLYYGFLIIIFFALPHFVSYGTAFAELLNEQIWYWTYLSNVDVAINGWHRFNGLGHFWSLAVEEQYYLMWPLVVYLLSRRKLAWTCAGLVIGALAFRLMLVSADMHLAAYVLTPARVDSLAVGGLIAVLWRSQRGARLLAKATLPVLLISGAVVAGLMLHYRGLGTLKLGVITFGYTAIALFFGALMTLSVSAPQSGLVYRIWNSPVLRFFGRYSYAIYVLHHLVAIYLPTYGFSASDIPAIGGSHLPGLLVFSVAATAVSVGLALISWFVLESPMLSLKHRFSYRQPPVTTTLTSL